VKDGWRVVLTEEVWSMAAVAPNPVASASDSSREGGGGVLHVGWDARMSRGVKEGSPAATDTF
jgi:hypothetical protein